MVDAFDESANRLSRHTESVMGDATQFHTLASEERFPELRTSNACMFGCPVYQICSILIRSQEEDFILTVQVDDLVLDTR